MRHRRAANIVVLWFVTFFMLAHPANNTDHQALSIAHAAHADVFNPVNDGIAPVNFACLLNNTNEHPAVVLRGRCFALTLPNEITDLQLGSRAAQHFTTSSRHFTSKLPTVRHSPKLALRI